MKIILVILLTLTAYQAHAVETYTKVAVHLIARQPYAAYVKADKYSLNFNPVGLEVEAGILVNTENDRDFITIGVSYWDSGSDRLFNTKRLEAFYDYTWQYNRGWYGKVGTGLKVYGDTTVEIEGVTSPRSDKVIDILTARFEIGKDFGNYSVFINHHSQWLRGKPFSNDWEYHTSSVGFSYKF